MIVPGGSSIGSTSGGCRTTATLKISGTRLPYSIPSIYESPQYRPANEWVLYSHAKLVYDDAAILLATAITDNVLVKEAKYSQWKIWSGAKDFSSEGA
jgi:hypothetical protein